MPLHVIGLGVAQQAVLGAPALKALQSADLVLGSARQLETVASALMGSQKTEVLPKLSELEGRLQQLLEPQLTSDESSSAPLIVVLASGDPLFYGIGKWLAQRFSANDLHFYPAVSSIQAACHHAAWSLQDVEVLSLHGRPVDKLRAILRAGQKIAILSDAQSSPDILAQICTDCGFGESTLLVCEAMGYAHEKVTKFKASELVDATQGAQLQFDPLHVTLIEVSTPEVSAQKNSDAALPSFSGFNSFPGFPDQSFITDKGEGKGMITKREVRLAILSLIQASPRDIIWDIGAGCGSVSCELAYWNANRPGSDEGQVYAIEHHPDRLSCLEANRHKFGLLSAVSIVNARAEEVVASLPKPDKVFVGGSGGELEQLLLAAWERLDLGGSLVSSAVTEASKQHLLAFYQARAAASDALVETVQVAISRGEMLAQELLYRPNLPVSLFKWEKV